MNRTNTSPPTELKAAMANTEKYVANHNREVGEIWQGNEYVAFAFSTSEYSAIENAQRIADCLNEADNLREEVKRLRGEYGPKVDYSNAPTLEDYGIRELDIIFAVREQVGKNLPRIDYSKFPRPTLEDLGLTEADVINSMSKDELINFIYKVGNKVSYCGFQESVNEKGLELVWERGGEDV